LTEAPLREAGAGPRRRASLLGILAGRRALLLAGSALLAIGVFLPEIAGLAGRALRPSAPPAPLSQSSWIVFRGAIAMLIDPSSSPPWGYSVFYAAEAAGLAYPVGAALAIAVGAVLPRSRAAALACYLFHVSALWGLALAALAVAGALGDPSSGSTSSGRESLLLAGAGLLLGAMAFAEMAASAVAGRRAESGGLPADAVNLPPAVLLLILNGVLWLRFRAHPNWPGGGYLITAVGALMAVLGMALGRRRYYNS